MHVRFGERTRETGGSNAARRPRPTQLQVYDVWFRPLFAFFIIDVNTKEERFLHPLSLSEFADGFVLKGAMMIRAWGGSTNRSTRDIVLLGHLNSWTSQR